MSDSDSTDYGQYGGTFYLSDDSGEYTIDIEGANHLYDGGGFKVPVYQIKGGLNGVPLKAHRWGFIEDLRKCKDYKELKKKVWDIIRNKGEQPPVVEGQTPIIFTNAAEVEDYIIAYTTVPGMSGGARRRIHNYKMQDWEEGLSQMLCEVFFYAPGTCLGFPEFEEEEVFPEFEEEEEFKG
ncbi:hypothetical protein ACHQM5_022482 [Ranunculus cassubicifolius]